MNEIPTRDEFDELAGDAISAGSDMASAVEWGSGVQAAFDKAGDAKSALLAAFATQSARIADLEAMLSHLEWCRIGWNICPMCGCPEMLGHDDDCELDALLPKEATDE